jgi:hypothetical protein
MHEGPAPIDGVVADPVPDPSGQTALLLVESLIHCLRERSLISVEDAVEIVDTALSVQTDITASADGAAPIMRRSLVQLLALKTSLERDLGDPSGQP